MTREEAVALLERYSNYDGMGIPNLAGCKEAMKVAVESLKEVYPELRESEDERIRKVIYKLMLGMSEEIFTSQDEIVTKEKALSYLEKQKETHYTKRNALFDKCVAECDPTVMKEVSDEIDEMLEKEQKPNPTEDMPHITVGSILKLAEEELLKGFVVQKPASTEDMPYITDEHFYEREPKDSFKYKLAEYMTKCCTKKEGPYGYEYGISAESILKMAEEELLKRGVVQKPAEWSNEGYGRLFDIEHYLDGTLQLSPNGKIACIDFLKSLRPLQKPKYCHHDVDETGWTEEYRKAYYDGWNNCNIQHEQLKEEQKCKYQNGFVSSDGSFYPVWSEEDEKIMHTMIKDGDLKPSEIAWLRSLRPQPKVELSEDVKKTLDEVSHILIGLNYKQIAKDYKQAIEKLLYSHPSWKPSEVCYGAKGDPDPAGVWKPSEEENG